MAFSYTKTEESVFDGQRFSHGTFTNGGGSTGGEIRTGLEQVQGVKVQPGGTAVAADHCTLVTAVPVRGGAVTIKTTANVTGYWFAFGY